MFFQTWIQMLKVLVIGTLLCGPLNGASEVSVPERNATIVREVKLVNSYSYTLTIDSQLYTVDSDFTRLSVNSTAENFKTCVIDFQEHSIEKFLEATVIDGKIIVWGIRTKYEPGWGSPIGTRVDHTVLIVDPWQCSFKPVSTFEEERPDRWFNPQDNLVRVVARNGSFDVFYPSLQTCAPCRYSLEGKRIDLKNLLRPEIGNEVIYFKIQSFNAPGVENGYFFAYKLGNSNESVIEILDADFHVVKRKNLTHPVNAIATNSSARPGVSVCYMTAPSWDTNPNDTVYCESFDADLQALFTIRLPMLEGYAPDSLSLSVDSQGDLYIPVVQSKTEQGISKGKFVYYKVDMTGKLLDVSTVYQLPDGFHGYWDIHGFFSNNTYCIEYIMNYMFYVKNKHEFVKCVDISKNL